MLIRSAFFCIIIGNGKRPGTASALASTQEESADNLDSKKKGCGNAALLLFFGTKNNLYQITAFSRKFLI